MFIYLKSNEKLQNAVVKDGNNTRLLGLSVFQEETCPYISSSFDVDGLLDNGSLKEFFLKATEIVFPDYSRAKRAFGIYKYGKATAKLTAGANCSYCLKIEVSDWESLRDLKIIQTKIYTGELLPVKSFEIKQGSHLLQILRQLLSTRKLSTVQRFFLSLRLLKA